MSATTTQNPLAVKAVKAMPMDRPGVYYDVPSDVYHAHPALNASTLKQFRKSPANAKHYRDTPKEPTPAMVFGTAAHTYLLEPDNFKAQYVLTGPCCGTTAKGDPCKYNGSVCIDGQWYCGTHAKKVEGELDQREPISQGDYDKIRRMADVLESKEVAWGFLHGFRKAVEVSVLWEHEPTGQMCKARVDVWPEAPMTRLVDLKTCRDASPDAFGKAIMDYRYDWSAAFYLHGLASLGESFDGMVLVAIEREPYHHVQTYDLKPELLVKSWEELEPLIGEYRKCDLADEWPDFPDEVVPIGTPYWDEKRRGISEEGEVW